MSPEAIELRTVFSGASYGYGPLRGPARSIIIATVLATAGCGGSPGPRDPALASQAPTRDEIDHDEAIGSSHAAEAEELDAPADAPRDANDGRDEIEPTDVDMPPPPPDERPALETLTGRASYYADRFHGRSTASGEPYDMHALTAASRDLPFGTVVRVVRVDTGASVVVRVNDRGPFRDHSRILDLSRAAAEALDMIRAGVVEIRAEILERGDGRRWRAPE